MALRPPGERRRPGGRAGLLSSGPLPRRPRRGGVRGGSEMAKMAKTVGRWVNLSPVSRVHAVWTYLNAPTEAHGPAMTDESLNHWIGRLNAGDIEAVERVFLAYERYLRIFVRRRLSGRLRSKVDSRDIV